MNMYIKKNGILFIILASLITSISTAYILLENGLLNLLSSAAQNTDLARQMISSSGMGLPYVGIYSPFFHTLMILFIWNKMLWHSGFAPLVLLILSFTVTNVYIYKSIRLFTNSYIAAFAGVSIFLFNVNILSLIGQSSPKIIFLMFSILIFYYTYKFLKENKRIYLFVSSILSALATLTLSAGIVFPIFISIFIILKYTLFQKNLKKLEGTLITFLFIALLGEIYTILYSLFVYRHISFLAFNNILPFEYLNTVKISSLNLNSIIFYIKSLQDTLGITLPIIAILSGVTILIKKRGNYLYYFTLILLSAPLYYLISILAGWDSIYISNNTIVTGIYIGSYFILFESIVPAILLGEFLDLKTKTRKLYIIQKVITYIVIAMITYLTLYNFYQNPYIYNYKKQILQSQSGAYTKKSVSIFDMAYVRKQKVMVYMQDTASFIQESKLNLAYVIDENNISYWEKAQKAPWKYAQYIVISKIKGNPLLNLNKLYIDKYYKIILNNPDYLIFIKNK